MYLKNSIKKYLDQLASDSPTPGGGGTSALVAALGIGLVTMVARIGLRRLDKRAQKVMNRIIGTLERMRRDAEEIVELDPKVYQEVMNSCKRLKGANHQELAKADVEKALTNSFRLQADLALLVAMAKELLTQVGLFAKGSIANDLIVAGGLLDGAFKGAAATARINVVYMKRGKNRSHCERALKKVEERYKKIRFE